MRTGMMVSDFAATAIGSLGVGYVIDLIFGTQPWWMVGLLFVGVISSFVRMVRDFSEADKTEETKAKEKNKRNTESI